jgi:hypothetical protein
MGRATPAKITDKEERRMKNKVRGIGYVLLAAALGIALVGCATTPSGSAGKSQEDLLRDAGFKVHTAKTPERLAYINTLPAKKVVSNKYQDKVLYLVCTESGSKQCFLGDEAAYKRYQQMAIQQSLSEDQHKVAEDRWDPEAQQMWVDSQGGG